MRDLWLVLRVHVYCLVLTLTFSKTLNLMDVKSGPVRKTLNIMDAHLSGFTVLANREFHFVSNNLLLQTVYHPNKI